MIAASAGTRHVLCVLSEAQKQSLGRELERLHRPGLELVFQDCPDRALDQIGQLQPPLVLVGMSLDGMEGLEFLALLLRRHADFAGKVIVIPDEGDPFPPMAQYRDAETGKSVTKETTLPAVLSWIEALVPEPARPPSSDSKPPAAKVTAPKLRVARPAPAQPAARVQPEARIAETPPPRVETPPPRVATPPPPAETPPPPAETPPPRVATPPPPAETPPPPAETPPPRVATPPPTVEPPAPIATVVAALPAESVASPLAAAPALPIPAPPTIDSTRPEVVTAIAAAPTCAPPSAVAKVPARKWWLIVAAAALVVVVVLVAVLASARQPPAAAQPAPHASAARSAELPEPPAAPTSASRPAAESELTELTTLPLRFDRGKTSGTITAPAELDTLVARLARAMAARPESRLEVGGHTSREGAEYLHGPLGDQRALDAKRRLVKLGIVESRIVSRNYEATRPLLGAGGKEDLDGSRRATVRLVD